MIGVLGDRAAAEDCAHDAFEKAYRAWPSWRKDAPADPASVAERSDLFKALRTLPPKQAAAIVLRHHHGYTNREIGAALGIPERTVASRLAAAKENLRRSMGYGPEAEPNLAMGTLEEDGVPSD